DRLFTSYPISWSKKWFEEDKSRLEFVNKDMIQTFKKFGSIIAMAILGGTKDTTSFKDFYGNMVGNIKKENERLSILQLGEIFSLIISKENYDLFDQIVENKFPVGNLFKNFIENYKISDKGKTILTLLFAKEINNLYVFEDDRRLESIIKVVYDRLIKYNSVIEIYSQKNIPEGLKTSLGLEYEVTKSIAKGYNEVTGSDYKKDIEILSCYSGIAKGNDAIHEIATKPTDNPYLLLLELKLLDDLNFIDLNFVKEDYSRGSRSYHITFGGEYGIEFNNNANFIQNILVAANLGGINTSNTINKVNRYSNIRSKGDDSELLFGNKKTAVTEYRCLAIDESEPFEKCLISNFNLNMAKQALEKYLGITQELILKLYLDEIKNIKYFKFYCEQNKLIKEEIKDERIWEMIYSFIKLQIKVISAINDHNENFFWNEVDDNDSDGYNNRKMFEGVISNDNSIQDKTFEAYQKIIQIDPNSFFEIIDPNFVNKFTKINNLFLKPPTGAITDGVNATAVFSNIKTPKKYIDKNDGSVGQDTDNASKRIIFDCIDQRKKERKGIYIIQGSSVKMIVNQIQLALLDFNEEIKLQLNSKILN
ncbi:hypothetical protein KAZ01_02395, partial [Candidatus Gracilibacteria bacterium]|nr:hypothetical protein [Candidatus Gracilibacteria bacterium]